MFKLFWPIFVFDLFVDIEIDIQYVKLHDRTFHKMVNFKSVERQEFCFVQNRQSPDFERPKLGNLRSGIKSCKEVSRERKLACQLELLVNIVFKYPFHFFSLNYAREAAMETAADSGLDAIMVVAVSGLDPALEAEDSGLDSALDAEDSGLDLASGAADSGLDAGLDSGAESVRVNSLSSEMSSTSSPPSSLNPLMLSPHKFSARKSLSGKKKNQKIQIEN